MSFKSFQFHYIQNNEQLQKAIEHINNLDPKALFLDTEFTRRTTYWPTIELLQLSLDGEKVFILDMQALSEFDSLIELLKNPHIVKVFHSARQDVESIWHHLRCIPAPLFDTQIAAAFLGFGLSAGLNDMVSLLLDYEMNKGEQYSDWQRRPLRDTQLTYAAEDVVVLAHLYEKLTQNLKELNREEWVAEAMHHPTDLQKIVMNPQDAWLRLKKQVSSASSLYFMIYLSALREQLAQELNLHRGRIIVDADLLALCEALSIFEKQERENPLPISAEWSTLQEIKSFTPPQDEKIQAQFLALCHKILKAYPTRCKKKYKQLFSSDRHVQFSHEQHQEYLKIKGLVNKKSEQLMIPSALLASSQMIEDYITQKTADHPLMTGWREKIFKEELSKI